jgi:hypothetical protein
MTDIDDGMVGRVLTRREVLKLLGLTGAAVLTGCTPGFGDVTMVPTGTVLGPATGTSGVLSESPTGVAVPACVVRPETTEGPYFVDEGLNRSDIRSDPATGEIRPGLPLELVFRVMRVGAEAVCSLAGRPWTSGTAALRVYSDVADPGLDTSGQKFLRGFQQTDGDWRRAFKRSTRAVAGRKSISFKIRSTAGTLGLRFHLPALFDDLPDPALRRRHMPPRASGGA